VSPEALKLCEELGIRVAAGYCPYMFLPQTPVLPQPSWFLDEVHRRLPGALPLSSERRSTHRRHARR
jgi:hypothetical protein